MRTDKMFINLHLQLHSRMRPAEQMVMKLHMDHDYLMKSRDIPRSINIGPEKMHANYTHA